MLDIIFLSYDETNAEANWIELQRRFPHAQRLHGIEGVKNAHRRAAELSRTDFFFVVDGDNSILPSFNFEVPFEPHQNSLYVWRCLNPVNDLVYGYGGVKLYNKFLLLNLNKPTCIDVATSVATVYVPVFVTASVTNFNSSAYEAWRGAFRECVKLTRNTIKNPNDRHSAERLQAWCSLGKERIHGTWSLKGANQGRLFAEIHHANSEKLSLINDFAWLKSHCDSMNNFTSENLPFTTL